MDNILKREQSLNLETLKKLEGELKTMSTEIEKQTHIYPIEVLLLRCIGGIFMYGLKCKTTLIEYISFI